MLIIFKQYVCKFISLVLIFDIFNAFFIYNFSRFYLIWSQKTFAPKWKWCIKKSKRSKKLDIILKLNHILFTCTHLHTQTTTGIGISVMNQNFKRETEITYLFFAWSEIDRLRTPCALVHRLFHITENQNDNVINWLWNGEKK